MATTTRVHVLNGPNINMTGTREPQIYGSDDYDALMARVAAHAEELGLEAVIRQSNWEGQIVEWIHEAVRAEEPVVINAAGLTFTSMAIMDAMKMVTAPKVEIHLSNVHKREPLYHRSLLTPVVDGVMAGFHIHSYLLAITWVAEKLRAG
jgi:3-dehydroquinate dehydratase-2